MTEYKPLRLSKIARDFGVGVNTVLEFLHKKGIAADDGPNTKIEFDVFQILQKEYSGDIKVKEASEKIELNAMRAKKESIYATDEFSEPQAEPAKKEPEPAKVEFVSTKVDKLQGPNVVGKIDLNKKPEKKPEPQPKKEQPKPAPEKPKAEKVEPELIKTKVEPVKDVKILGKIELDQLNTKTRPAKKSKEEKIRDRKEREAQSKKLIQQQQAEARNNKQRDERPQREEPEFINTKVEKLQGPNVVGKIDLDDRKHSGGDEFGGKKKKRKRIQKDRVDVGMPMDNGKGGKGGKGAKGLFAMVFSLIA